MKKKLAITLSAVIVLILAAVAIFFVITGAPFEKENAKQAITEYVKDTYGLSVSSFESINLSVNADQNVGTVITEELSFPFDVYFSRSDYRIWKDTLLTNTACHQLQVLADNAFGSGIATVFLDYVDPSNTAISYSQILSEASLVFDIPDLHYYFVIRDIDPRYSDGPDLVGKIADNFDPEYTRFEFTDYLGEQIKAVIDRDDFDNIRHPFRVADPENAQRLDLDLEKALAEEDIDDLVLSIYTIENGVRFRIPPDMNVLRGNYEYKKEITGDALAEHLDLFYKVKGAALVPYKSGGGLYAFVGYFLESRKNGVLLEVGYLCSPKTIQVNGVEVLDSPILSDIFYTFATPEMIADQSQNVDLKRRLVSAEAFKAVEEAEESASE
ncbi:MAG: hypothetical protein E7656_01145 [Ruminococcaceae bacterium]|nr:hypothetical protein [Oscillospiraceae bacterium]